MSKITQAEADLQAKLGGPDWDSSDEEQVEETVAAAAAAATKTTSGKKRHTSNAEASSVLYIGHLPAGMEEHELFVFLKQFGKVTRLRLSRSKKTNNSRGYAFCQMQSPSVANIVADTLAGYIIFGQKRLVCHIVPTDKIHNRLFYYSRPKKKTKPDRSLQKIKMITGRLIARDRKRRQKLQEMGIEYDFPGYEGAMMATADKDETDKKPKDSIVSLQASDDSTSKKTSKKDRKDSTATAESPQQPSVSEEEKGSNRKRKESTGSTPSEGFNMRHGNPTGSDSKRTRTDSMASEGSADSQRRAQGKAMVVKEAKTAKKSKRKHNKKDKSRRNSAP